MDIAPVPITPYELNYNENGVNVVIKKAFEGNDADVNALLKDGAELADAVYGYAYGNHDEQVNALLSIHPMLYSAAARGYARAQNIAQVTKMSAIDALKTSLVFGFSQAGDEGQVRAALNAREGSKYLPTVVQGLASTGQSKLLLELIDGTRYYPEALRAAAKSGLNELVGQLLARLSIELDALEASTDPTSLDVKRYLSYALEGYAEGRHFTDAIRLIRLGANPMHGLNRLAVSGTIDPMDASQLLSVITENPIKIMMAERMKTQFDVDVDELKPSVAIDLRSSLFSEYSSATAKP